MLAKKAALAIDAKKGEDIVLIDVQGLSSVTDYMLLATGSSPPHLKAMFSGVLQALKERGVTCYRHSGSSESGWIVMDYIDAVIHILSPEMRRYYAIEELCPTAPRPNWSTPRTKDRRPSPAPAEAGSPEP